MLTVCVCMYSEKANLKFMIFCLTPLSDQIADVYHHTQLRISTLCQ